MKNAYLVTKTCSNGKIEQHVFSAPRRAVEFVYEDIPADHKAWIYSTVTFERDSLAGDEIDIPRKPEKVITPLNAGEWIHVETWDGDEYELIKKEVR